MRKIRSLSLTQLTCVLNRLLESGNLGADLVVTALDGRHTIALLGVESALLLDRGFGRALIGERRLHGQLALTHCTVVHFKAAVEITQSQREQFGGQSPLLLLERLIAARRRSLPLQMPDLLFNFVTKVLETLEVLARIGDAALRFLAPLLVTRDSRGFLDKGAHVVGLGLDHARDHALLDDRVAARSQAGA